MEAKGKALYPILVRGDCGPQRDSKTLQNKLCCYFLSQKRSGGGECFVEFCDGQIRVCFEDEEARRRVLARGVHEIELPEKGKVRLEIQLPGANEEQNAEEVKISKCEPILTEAAKVPGDVMSAEQNISRETDSILVTFSGETIDDDVLEMYFENSKRSGGGPVKSIIRGNEGIQIIFENVKDAMEVLNGRGHTIHNAHIEVQPSRKSCIVKEQTPTVRSSSVLLQNVPDHMTLEMLTLLIGNISEDLADDDFTVERIPELNVAVATLKNSDVEEIHLGRFLHEMNH